MFIERIKWEPESYIAQSAETNRQNRVQAEQEYYDRLRQRFGVGADVPIEFSYDCSPNRDEFLDTKPDGTVQIVVPVIIFD